MLGKKQLITIKGTRDGLTMLIDDTCLLEEAIKELTAVLSASKLQKNDPTVSVTVKIGNRYLTEQQKEQLTRLIESDHHFSVQAFESNLIPKDEALHWMEKNKIKAFNRVVRSGQVLHIEGDLLLIGDVNPGGKVVSTGDIYIMGNLRGIAHAGINGNREAVIVASFMKPTQLRIADYISRAPDYETDGVYMECGFIDEEEDKIMIDRLQVLSRKSKRLSGFERRMQNG
ncbi:MAG TPA: septum site-determining protein MinC [Bacillota bacterium]